MGQDLQKNNGFLLNMHEAQCIVTYQRDSGIQLAAPTPTLQRVYDQRQLCRNEPHFQCECTGKEPRKSSCTSRSKWEMRTSPLESLPAISYIAPSPAGVCSARAPLTGCTTPSPQLTLHPPYPEHLEQVQPLYLANGTLADLLCS